ncbi:MAG: TlpA family protein disulfide reductase [Phycisphaerales bacterium]|jgi:peroxiredoxin|nr:TlpA family protein disulfide reductase [Phycisphaerales bacterium]
MPDHKRLTICLLTVSLISFIVVVGSPENASAAAAAANKEVPQTLLAKMNANFRPKARPTSQAEFIEIMTKQTLEVIKLGLSAESEYPGAQNLSHARGMMLEAAGFLQETAPSSAHKAQLLGIAGRIMKAPASAKLKAQADFIITRWKIAPSPRSIAKDAEKQIRAYMKRHSKTTAKTTAVIRGTIMAGLAKLTKLQDELAAILEKDHADTPGITAFLLSIGRRPLFRATLTKLDATTLTLPDDMLGKVLVIDFWATWCRPCIQSLPRLKQTYATYKSKGVEIIGISFDRSDSRDMLTKFVKKHNLNWTHTYSGKYWDDPTGKKYGVTGIPAVWVIGRDGRIVSNNARSNLDEVINKALKTKPAK